MISDSEFRVKYRQDVDLMAGIEGSGIIDFAHHTKIKNMNAYGMCIETGTELSIGEKRNIRFFIGSGISIRLHCRVIWHRKMQDMKHAYGLIYNDVSFWQKMRLLLFMIKKRSAEARAS